METQEQFSPRRATKALEVRRDRYLRARGGTAKFLNLYCSKCNTWLLLYQKDGEGRLLRCYLNRIFAPTNLEALQYDSNIVKPRDLKPLSCTGCGERIGIPILHHDGRLSFHLIHGAFKKQIAVDG